MIPPSMTTRLPSIAPVGVRALFGSPMTRTHGNIRTGSLECLLVLLATSERMRLDLGSRSDFVGRCYNGMQRCPCGRLSKVGFIPSVLERKDATVRSTPVGELHASKLVDRSVSFTCCCPLVYLPEHE